MRRRAPEVLLRRGGWIGRATVAGAIIGATLGLVALAQSYDGQRLLRDAGIVARDPGIIALSFDSPQTLPTSLVRSWTPVVLPVTIGNGSSVRRTVTLAVTISGSRVRGGSAMRREKVTVKADASRMLRLALVVRCTSRTRIAVALSTGQSIGMWANCAERTAPRRAHSRARGRRLHGGGHR